MTWFIAFLFWVYCICVENQSDMLLLFSFHLYAISWLSELDIWEFLVFGSSKRRVVLWLIVFSGERTRFLLFRWLLGLVGDMERTW